jgi:CubicO group peptidase (beta-lactamase class C family)
MRSQSSISKPTTTLAALRLVQDGKLNLDENVNTRLTEWTVPENEFTKVQKVTLRRLVSHSAGLNVHGFDGYASGEPVPTILQILNGKKPANTAPIRVETVPGTTWRYSGGGYTILQLLLTEVESKPFPQILDDLVLRPAGMTHSTFQQPLPQSRRSEAATPYRANGKPVEGGFHTYPEMAAAGLWTTPSDLSLMAIEVQKEYAGESNKILSREMTREMLSPQKDHWGLGFAIGDSGGKLFFGHGGSDEGFESRLEAYTELGQGIAIMTNGARGDELIREVLCAVAEEYDWPDFHPVEHAVAKLPPRMLSANAGTYQFGNGNKLVVSVKDGQVYLEGMTPSPLPLMPESETNFFILTDEITFRFQRDAGVVTSLTVYDGGEVREATKVTK